MRAGEPVNPQSSIKYTRTPYIIKQVDGGRDVYGSLGDAVILHSHLLRGDIPSDTVYIGMHPIGAPMYFPFFTGLAKAGLHVIACANRYSNGDSALQMENVLLDLGACVSHAREELGYEKVVLVGWSGGGALMTGYQAEAEKPRITATAAGESTALASTSLPPANAVLFVAAHRSRHHLLTEFLDASVLDEGDPRKKDPLLNLYDKTAGEQPPYSAEFVRVYREAQRARNRRITEQAQERLAELKRGTSKPVEHCFVVHGTMADPRWLDLTVEPNGRLLGSYLGDPEPVNNGPAGLARFTTARSWLSQWGLETAQIDAVDAAPRITVSVLTIVPGRDDCCPRPHQTAFHEGLSSKDKTWVDVPDANHYLAGVEQGSHLREVVGEIVAWAGARDLATCVD
jgi:pimeloyl-ACP methyl ester carboxylesterase